MVAFATIATTNFEPCNNMPNPRIRALLKSHKSASSIHMCASIRPFLLRCILGQTQTKIPDVIPCNFIVKCSGFVIHHINLSHVTAEACPTTELTIQMMQQTNTNYTPTSRKHGAIR